MSIPLLVLVLGSDSLFCFTSGGQGREWPAARQRPSRRIRAEDRPSRGSAGGLHGDSHPTTRPPPRNIAATVSATATYGGLNTINGFPVVALVCSLGGADTLLRVLGPLPGDLCLDRRCRALPHLRIDDAGT